MESPGDGYPRRGGTIVLVVLKPLHGSASRLFKIPKPEEVARISAVARILNPCHPDPNGVHPAGPSLERRDGERVHRFRRKHIAYPLQGTIEYAREIGLETKSVEMCCSLI